MSAMKKERTPEQVAAAKVRMAAVRAKKGSSPRPVVEAVGVAKAFVEHKRSAAIPDEFKGLTAHDCPAACRPDRCVISGVAHCIHPLKSGIQSVFQTKADVVERYSRARKILAHAKIDLS